MLNVTAESTHTLEVPGATLAYDVHPGSSPETTPLFLIGSPMAAPGFATLASHFTDRPVITYDPRGSERSQLTQPTIPPTPDEHAADLHRIIKEIGGGPIDLFASSGGAVNAASARRRYPDDLRTLVAHEPPLPKVLPDRDAALAAAARCSRDVHAAGMGRRDGSFHRRRQPPRRVRG